MAPSSWIATMCGCERAATARASRSNRPHPRVLGEALGQHLDRDLAMQARVAGAIDLAHPARAQRSDDLVLSETGTGGEGHGAG